MRGGVGGDEGHTDLRLQVVPFKFRQVLNIPYIVMVEIILLPSNNRRIQRLRHHFCDLFVRELNPSFFEIALFVAAEFHATGVLLRVFGGEEDPVNGAEAGEEVLDFKRAHVGRDPGEVDDAGSFNGEFRGGELGGGEGFEF